MRTSILLIFITMSFAASAQDMIVSAFIEQTIAGRQYGTSISFETKSGWGFGGFYQQDLPKVAEQSTAVQTFYGGQIQAPLCKLEKLALFAKVRSGLSNQNFFVVTPSLETRWAVTKRVGLAFEMGLRMNHASVSGKLYARLF